MCLKILFIKLLKAIKLFCKRETLKNRSNNSSSMLIDIVRYRHRSYYSSSEWTVRQKFDRNGFAIAEISRNFLGNLTTFRGESEDRFERDDKFGILFQWTRKLRSSWDIAWHTSEISLHSSELEQQILLVSCLSFSRRGGYDSKKICYRYIMRKNWLDTLFRHVFRSFCVVDDDTRYFQYRNIFFSRK